MNHPDTCLIREALPGERDAVLAVNEAAFGAAEGAQISRLVDAMLDDPTARPLLSLVAAEGDRLTGHVLFTRVELEHSSHDVVARILAPLAVSPAAQGRGVGGALIRAGLDRLEADGVGLVFVLGHIGYYPRFGFEPAGPHGFEAPYPIPPAVADAWMVVALRPGLTGFAGGRVRCCAALDHPEHWIE